MRWGLWLVASVVLTPLVLPFAQRVASSALRPSRAAAALLAAELTIAAATLCAVAVLAWPLVARVPLVGAVGQWSTGRVGDAVGIPLAVSVAAAVLGAAILVRLVGTAVTQAGRVQETMRTIRAIGGTDTVVIVADPVPFAHALYGWRARDHRIVVSQGLVDALTAEQLASVVAHERSHLRHHHALSELASEVTVAINPLLRRTAADLDFTLERWADEDAGAQLGRVEVARTLQRAGLARIASARLPAMSFHFSRSDVPARVEALTREPPRTRWVGVVPYLVLIGLVGAGVLRALERTEDLVEALQRLH